MAGWLASTAALAALFYVEPRAGVLAAMAGLVAVWLRRQRVPREHVAGRALYVRSARLARARADADERAPGGGSTQG